MLRVPLIYYEIKRCIKRYGCAYLPEYKILWGRQPVHTHPREGWILNESLYAPFSITLTPPHRQHAEKARFNGGLWPKYSWWTLVFVVKQGELSEKDFLELMNNCIYRRQHKFIVNQKSSDLLGPSVGTMPYGGVVLPVCDRVTTLSRWHQSWHMTYRRRWGQPLPHLQVAGGVQHTG